MDFLSASENERLSGLYDAQLVLYRAMAQIPAGDGPCLPRELLMVADARQYLAKQVGEILQ